MNASVKQKRVFEEISRLLPNVKLGTFSWGASETGIVHHTHYIMSKENKDLINSEYYFKGCPSFMHFTTLYSLESMIAGRNLRLYNLYNLNDPREFSFAGNLTLKEPELRKDAKENLFLLSMCQPEILKGPISTEFNLWRLYGDQGNGIAIEFNFENNIREEWKDYFLSEVFYGTSSKTKLKELGRLLKEYPKETPEITLDIGSLACFHKSNLFKVEKEIRLLFDKREKKQISCTRYMTNEQILSPITELDVTKSVTHGKPVRYLELPLYHQTSEKTFSDIAVPSPKIERIVIGYQYNNNYAELKSFLDDLCLRKLGYIPKIEQSRLTKYYHEVL